MISVSLYLDYLYLYLSLISTKWISQSHESWSYFKIMFSAKFIRIVVCTKDSNQLMHDLSGTLRHILLIVVQCTSKEPTPQFRF